MTKNYWLLKTEGYCYSIDDLKKDKKVAWTGVRNFQARNFMRDNMKVGDGVLVYHSSSDPSGVFGLAKVTKTGVVDETAFDTKDEHFDPKSKRENPTWICVEISFVRKFKQPFVLQDMKVEPRFSKMRTLQRGNRLSVMPVTKEEFEVFEKHN
jgi:predicted RNA-binding protein with PUA-like domain